MFEEKSTKASERTLARSLSQKKSFKTFQKTKQTVVKHRIPFKINTELSYNIMENHKDFVKENRVSNASRRKSSDSMDEQWIPEIPVRRKIEYNIEY